MGANSGQFVKTVDDRTRFLSYVVPDSRCGCWWWAGSPRRRNDAYDYGRISIGPQKTRVNMSAHHWAYQHWNGTIPAGKWVLHHCDHPGCVNPDHLYLGDQLDNERDKTIRGRRPRGVKHAGAVLSEEQVRAIFYDPRLHRLIAADYGITKGHVAHIKRKIVWKHLWLS